MADANRLSTQVTGHTVFEENQVLTSEQLNEVVGYLDRQQRLTRARLHGVGIVCGLQLEMIAAEVSLSPGTALTSDGDLLNVEETLRFGQFKEYSDRDAQYPHFMVEEITMPLYELVEKGGTPLTSFTAATERQLANMVAVLYLESYFYDPDLCTGSGCDNKGKQARNNLKVLLVDVENAQLLLGDDLFLGRRYPFLESYKVPRVILDPDDISDYTDLGTQYRNVILQAIPDLQERLQKTWQPLIRPLLRDLYGKIDPTLKWVEILDGWRGKVQNSLFAVQYLYGFLHELAQAYDEFKEALFADNFICVPPVELFPKHVLLGGNGDLSAVRHGFYESPQLNRKDQVLARIRFLHYRLDRMLRLFDVPKVTSTIRITPSRSKCVDLGGRAIPYYYQPDKLQPLTGSWNYDLNQRGQQSGIYNYHAEELGGTTEAKEPLNYDLYPYDFFRIEGHLGADVEKVASDLEAEVENYNLPINILTLQIETAFRPWRIRPLAPMRDLKALHRFHRMDLLQQVGNLSKFSDRVAQVVADSPDIPEKDVEADTLSYKAFLKINLGQPSMATSSATTATDESPGELNTAINLVGQGLKTNFSQFRFTEFKTNYKSMVNLAAGVNRSLRGVTYTSAFTPYELTLSDNKFKWLGWIEDLLAKRLERAEELSVFARFLQQAPAMEHLGGVPKGGTFILVYSGASKKVLADFCLPYWHVDLPEADELEDQAVEESEFSWVDLNDFMIKRSNLKDLTKQVGDAVAKVESFDWRLRSQETITDNVLIKVEPPKVDLGEQFRDDYLGAGAGALEGLYALIEGIDKRIEEGKSTPAEEILRKKAEEMGSGIIEETIKNIGSKETDVLSGSEEAKFIDVAMDVSTKMSATEKQNLSDRLAVVQESAAEKPVMVEMLDKMIVGR